MSSGREPISVQVQNREHQKTTKKNPTTTTHTHTHTPSPFYDTDKCPQTLSTTWQQQHLHDTRRRNEVLRVSDLNFSLLAHGPLHTTHFKALWSKQNKKQNSDVLYSNNSFISHGLIQLCKGSWGEGGFMSRGALTQREKTFLKVRRERLKPWPSELVGQLASSRKSESSISHIYS